MNPTAQPRQFASGPRALPQQPYYPSRPTLPANSGRVQPSPAPRPIPPPHGPRPPHVFQPGPSQMMMIPQQPISFPNSQGTAYYISGRVSAEIF
ncbi:serine/threonine-protein kinase WNK2-like, partial [Sinocyclocheilus anshuiensis]|uniref:serine/threonine-protein kinase WNK2-like n=1 Tax=Sinocyclocheilus anshuiensis TaxID=1608454 RepID=UPI0007B9812C